MKRKKFYSRREFIRWMSIAGAGALVSACNPKTVSKNPVPGQTSSPSAVDPTATLFQPQPSPTGQATDAPRTTALETKTQPMPSATPQATYLTVARGEDPAAITRAALAGLGGMEKFMQPGANVIIKPNICADSHGFEYASTTNPLVVAALVSLCWEAGAKRVRVMDHPFSGTAQSAYHVSGIADAVAQAGGEMEVMNPNKYQNFTIPDGRDIREWVFYKDILEADLLINVPIAKQHSAATLTLGGKNLMGVVSHANMIHANLHQRIADLVSVVRPQLTVIDAVRTLMDHGPTGGNLADVRLDNTVIASHDIVAADSYATTLFGLKGSDIEYIQMAANMGLGNIDLDSIRIEEITV